MSAGTKDSLGFLERFGSAQLGWIVRMARLARELTGEFFQMGGDEAMRVPYEVRTLHHLDRGEIHADGVLADIARYEYRESRFGRKRDLYRVNLQDHNILKSLRRTREGVKFSPLLLYILTHEIIHVVRFVKFLAPFHLGQDERAREERLVHETARNILTRVPIAGMQAVLDRYERMAEQDRYL